MNSSEKFLLESLPNPKFNLLIAALSKSNNWKKIAKFSQIFNEQEIATLSTICCPATKLLHEFINRLWSVEFLQYILKECRLYEALAAISDPEPMQIISQPVEILKGKEKLQVPLGDSFEIKFEVAGIPFPKFQWFKDDDALLGETDWRLTWESFQPKMAGMFHCVAIQAGEHPNELKSDPIQVDVLPIPCTLLEDPEKIVYLCEGSFLYLRLKVGAYPNPTYQWLYENNSLKDETQSYLLIKSATEENSGTYRCFIHNQISELVVKIKVVIYSESHFQVYKGPVSNKVALLIGNEAYDHLSHLKNSSNDISSLAGILQTLGFRTFCLLNLNLREIELAVKLFSDVLDREAIAFFYYVGHGFEMGDRFLLPVDVPKWEELKKVDAVSESFVLQQLLNVKPLLLVLLLDMCLKMPDNLENPGIHEEVFTPHAFDSNRNLIRGYSTTSHLSSYEVEEHSNGVYVGILKKYLRDDSSILTILSKVNSEISSTCPNQMPCISYITSQDFYLNGKLCGCTAAAVFEALKVEPEEIIFGGTKICFQQFKRVFDNCFELIISRDSEVHYKLLSDCQICEVKLNDISKVLVIKDVQRMETDEFAISLTVNDLELIIRKNFQIVNLFLDV